MKVAEGPESGFSDSSDAESDSPDSEDELAFRGLLASARMHACNSK